MCLLGKGKTVWSVGRINWTYVKFHDDTENSVKYLEIWYWLNNFCPLVYLFYECIKRKYFLSLELYSNVLCFITAYYKISIIVLNFILKLM